MTARLLGGRYLLESEVARGGMAVVWRAVDNVLGRTVAAKVLHSHLNEDSTFRERFRIEALAAARLTHPNIVSIFDTGSDDGLPFIVMEYLAGGTLRDMVSSRGRLDPETVARIGAEACAALSYAHRQGVVHRDIKPANILFSEHGHVKVGDFGIAKAAFAQASLTDSGAVLGTVRYLAPEQVEGIEPDGRADIFSLAVVMYEALTGNPAFSGEGEIATATARLDSPPPPLRRVRPDVAGPLEAAIMRCLNPARDERFPDAAAFGAALENAGLAEESPARRKPRQAPRAPGSRRRAKPAGGGFLRAEAGWLVPTILVIILAAGLTIAVPSVRDRV
ncbi:MAG: serine/threonine-protein kinase, partial [Actinomycetota bacterium]